MMFSARCQLLTLLIFIVFQMVTVSVCLGQDDYETDDSYVDANVITPDESTPQHHTIHHANDGMANSSTVQVTIAIDQVPLTFLMLLMKEKKPVP